MAFYRWTGGNGGTPPTPTAEPYIYNAGEVGFNTGHKHTANTRVRLKAVFETWYGYGQVFGARSNNYATAAFGFFPWFDGTRPCYYRTGQEKTGSFFDAAADTTQMFYGVPIILECTGNTATWHPEDEPTNIHTLTAESGTVDAGIAPMGLFCGNNSTPPDSWAYWDPARFMILYWAEIYEGNTLVHRYTPAYNNGQYCLWDEVEQDYLYEVNGNYSRLRGSSNIPTT